ncbi:MAG: hypothetical protein CSA96_06360 [Bacteroidetes bacterium]|nr:MAG: hypothetical protein CSA96_06360 [Bacteroidota bacterium]
MIRRVLQLLIMATTCLPLSAQLIRVQTSISTDSIMIGERFKLDLQVEAQSGLNLHLPEFRDTLGSNLEVLKMGKTDSMVSEGKTTLSRQLELSSFEPGLVMIPSLEVIYATEDRMDTARSMPLMLTVLEPQVDTSKAIMPIKAPLNTPLTFREALPWLLWGCIAGLLALFLFWLLRRYLRKKEAPETGRPKKQLPAHIQAFAELDELKNDKLWERGELKLFYTRLTDIVRRYIEQQYLIRAMEQTTEEILGMFRKANNSDELLEDMLRDLLQMADLVKFAKADPGAIDNQTNLNNAYIFVQKTYPLFYAEPVQGKEVGDV